MRGEATSRARDRIEGRHAVTICGEEGNFKTRARKGPCRWRPRSYTRSMKTAVSLPDDVFRAAERHARRARKSRSQLYAEALSEYLARHAPDEVTDAMNRALDQLPESTDSFVRAASLRILERSER